MCKYARRRRLSVETIRYPLTQGSFVAERVVKQGLVRHLSALFFLSGAAALIYQVAWQRALFSYIGIDVVSVATIVAVFMLGLGAGAVVGGNIADQSRKLIAWFSGIELCIGLYGIASIWIIRALTNVFSLSGPAASALVALAALLIPTILMGATLPILVIQANREWGNIGQSTGRLYLVNTLGAAAGALGCGFLLFQFLTLTQGVFVAAAINLLVSINALLLQRSASS